MNSFIDPSSSIGDGTTTGRFTIVEADVEIGAGCKIGHGVVIHEGTRIGSNVRIDDNSVIGKQPMRAPNSAVTRGEIQPPAKIGDNSLIGACSIVYAGAEIGDNVLIADLASIRENVSIGSYTIVGRGVSIENKCSVGRYCKLETNVYLTAYSVVEDRCFIAPGVLTSNDNYAARTEERFKHFKGVVVRRGGRIAVGAVILPGKEVGADAMVGAGALLTKDAESNTVYVGLPARRTGNVPDEQRLDNQGWSD